MVIVAKVNYLVGLVEVLQSFTRSERLQDLAPLASAAMNKIQRI